MPEYKPTVMPKDESLNRQDNNLGAPGIQLPKNPENIAAFQKYSDVDAKELNAKLNSSGDFESSGDYRAQVQPQDESLQRQDNNLGAPGIQLPQNPRDIDAFNSVRNVNAKDLNADLNKK